MKPTLIYQYVYLMIACLALTLASTGTSYAVEKDKAARRAALMMQKMKQDMEAEKAAMQTQFDAQKKELEDKLKVQDETIAVLDKKLASSEAKVRNLGAEIKKTNAEKIALEDKLLKTQTDLDLTRKNLADLNVQYKQAQTDLAFNDNQRKTQSANLAKTTKSLASCEAKNDKLYQYGKDLVQLYDNPSRYEAAMRKETFLQLKRVELENILQNQQDKLDAERVVQGGKAD